MTSVSDATVRPFFPKELLARAAKLAMIPYEELVGPERKRHHVRVRAVAIQVMSERGLSLSGIGRLMNRDHSSICNLYHHFDRYYADDELAQAMLNTLRREFLSPKAPKEAVDAAPPPTPEPNEVRDIATRKEKRFYDFSSIAVGEVRAYRIADHLDASRIRKAAHNRNAMADVYYRTKTVGDHIHVIRVR